MFVTVKINEDLSPGTMVCHDTGDTWRKATSSDVAPLGVLKGSTFLDDDSARWGVVVLSGSCFIRAGAGITEQGGWLGCDDEGRAIIQASEDCGLIAPVSRGGSVPALDDLILVHLR
jgi:hypothetical protein